MYLPLNYEQINVIESTYFPTTVKAYNNMVFDFWSRALFQRACSTLEIGVPEIWKKHLNLMYWVLFCRGYVGMGEMVELGKWFNPVTVSGVNFYYEPVTAILTNPVLKERSGRELVIGKDVEILKLTPDWQGIFDVIFYYAEKLASMDCAINTAIINTKFSYIVAGKNKAAAETLKKIFDKISRGEPAVFFDGKLANDPTSKDEPWQALFRDNLKNNYIITDLLRDFQTILNDFDCEVGIPTIPYEKKERMVTSEAESRQIDATSRSVIWYDELSRTMEICNEFMGFTGSDKLTVKLRYEQKEGEEDVVSENNTNRDVQLR